MSEQSLSTVQVAQLAGLSYRQLDSWCRQQVIGSTGACGSGSLRKITPREAAIAVALARLIRDAETVGLAIPGRPSRTARLPISVLGEVATALDRDGAFAVRTDTISVSVALDVDAINAALSVEAAS